MKVYSAPFYWYLKVGGKKLYYDRYLLCIPSPQDGIHYVVDVRSNYGKKKRLYRSEIHKCPTDLLIGALASEGSQVGANDVGDYRKILAVSSIYLASRMVRRVTGDYRDTLLSAWGWKIRQRIPAPDMRQRMTSDDLLGLIESL